MSAPLTPTGEAAVAELAERYRVSDGAVRALLDAVIRGGGAMAQFSHPDLGGSGQWMRGGMTMVGDMFNSGLQSTVSGICSELSAQLSGGATLVSRPERSAPGSAAPTAGGFAGSSDFVDSWWPAELGRPSSSGGQNDDSYAYFSGPRRLAIRHGPALTIYDTGDHVISGVQQQQGGRGSVEFTSQLGSFMVETLSMVDTKAATGEPPPALESPAAAPRPAESPASPSVATRSAGTAAEIGAAIETLAGLRDKGLLTDDEFTTKKTELLARL